MANERKTEEIVRELFRNLEYPKLQKEEKIFIEEQGSENPEIQNLLKTASKNKLGKGIGKPEFIIWSPEYKDFIVIIECKADSKFHESKNLDKFKEYAVDGARNYALNLTKSNRFNVIFIGISGTEKSSLKISTFVLPKGQTKHSELLDKKQKPVKEILNFKDYIHLALYDREVEKKKREELLDFSRKLHNYMRDYAKVSETEKPLLVSGSLIALMNNAFSKNYRDYDNEKELASEFFSAIKRVIKNTEMPPNKKENMLQPYSFIAVHPELNKKDKKTKQTPLYKLINDIDDHVKPFIDVYTDYDVIGQFYGEFLRYTGGDKKGLGIVLTPKHITELFTELVTLTPKTIVLDICAGTGGFLISSMKNMLLKAKNEKEEEHIKNNCLIGVEQQPNMFALLASNMILRGDGKANLHQGNCFDVKNIDQIKNKADFGMINPPYSQKGEGLHELDFVFHLLNLLKHNGIGIAIVPMSCAISSHPVRQKILDKHRLEAVMSMPNELFSPIGAITCIMVFTAHTPHDEDTYHKTWFGYWKDDGFVKTKHNGRVDEKNRWNTIKNEWISAYRDKKEISGVSVLKKVSDKDEWCAEAFMETDYSNITEIDFINELKKYTAFKILNASYFKNKSDTL